MAFWDDLGKKATDATSKALQKAQEFSETTRLNSLISEEEKKINNVYCQIGKLYVAIHTDDCESNFETMILTLKESEAKMKEYKKQLQDIKGVQHCEKCGAEVPTGVAFCSACGSPMPKVQPSVREDIFRCPNCGGAVKKGMRFCTACGNPMPQPEEKTAERQMPEFVPEEYRSETEEEKLCPICGTKIQGEAGFCTECGAKLN